MAGLPQLIQEDIDCMDVSLDGLLGKSEAVAALLIDKGGPLVHQRGDASLFDTTTIAALAAGSFSATQAIAGLVNESNFNNIYQQGERISLLVSNIDDDLLLIIIFKADQSVGVMKYYANVTVTEIATQLAKARLRLPGETMDLVSMNVLDVSGVFQQKAGPTPEEILAQAQALIQELGYPIIQLDLVEQNLVLRIGNYTADPPGNLAEFCAQNSLQLEVVRGG